LRERLGARAFEAAVRHGEAMDGDEAVAFACAAIEQVLAGR
jgi:hypothetical protein